MENAQIRRPPEDKQVEDPFVSVIIVNWNTRDYLDQTLGSLFSYDHGFNIEVIVVDNGSTDGSTKMVRARWPKVNLVVLKENIGFAAANNIGIELSVGEYLLFLNSDTICLPTTILGAIREFKEDHSVGCVGMRHLNQDGSFQPSTNAFPTLLNDILELTELSRFKVVQRYLSRDFPWWSDHDQRMESGWVNGACMMVRRLVIQDVNGFDEDFFAYVEEVDLCFRIHKAGWSVIFTPKAEVIHLEGKSLDSNPGLRLRLRFWGHAHFYKKHYSAARYLFFRFFISVMAAGRITAMLMLSSLQQLGYKPPQHIWPCVVGDNGKTSFKEWLVTWFYIMCHSDIGDVKSKLSKFEAKKRA